MAFYDEMQTVAETLITEYGSSCVLNKLSNNQIFNPLTQKNEQTFEEYKGVCIMKPYTAEMIGSLSNIIKAGDVEFKCVLNDKTVVATEGKDKIIFGGITYNILSVSITNPSGSKILVQTFQARRASR